MALDVGICALLEWPGGMVHARRRGVGWLVEMIHVMVGWAVGRRTLGRRVGLEPLLSEG